MEPMCIEWIVPNLFPWHPLLILVLFTSFQQRLHSIFCPFCFILPLICRCIASLPWTLLLCRPEIVKCLYVSIHKIGSELWVVFYFLRLFSMLPFSFFHSQHFFCCEVCLCHYTQLVCFSSTSHKCAQACPCLMPRQFGAHFDILVPTLASRATIG